MKRFVLALALVCALSSTALAGDIHTVDAPAPGDVPSTGATAPGDVPSTDVSILLTFLDLAF